MPGPLAKRDGQRRRQNEPESYKKAGGLVKPVGAADPPESLCLPGDTHVLVRDLWRELTESAEAQFFTAADWQRARIELWNLNMQMSQAEEKDRPVGPTAWAAIQAGLNTLLLSPETKRRVAIEIQRAAPQDADEAAAVSSLDEARRKFGA